MPSKRLGGKTGDRRHAVSRENWARCGEFGLTGLPAPEGYGGGGFDIVTTMLALEARAEPHKLDDLLVEFNSRRLLFEASLDNWPDAQGGWTRRLFRGLLVARSLA